MKSSAGKYFLWHIKNVGKQQSQITYALYKRGCKMRLIWLFLVYYLFFNFLMKKTVCNVFKSMGIWEIRGTEIAQYLAYTVNVKILSICKWYKICRSIWWTLLYVNKSIYFDCISRFRWSNIQTQLLAGWIKILGFYQFVV